MNQSNTSPIKNVIDGGYCIGCGGCAAMEEALRMEFDSFGLPRPAGDLINEHLAGEVCPFGSNRTEDDIGNDLYRSSGEYYDQRVGYFKKIYAGHVSVREVRNAGGSSGFVTWLLIELLKHNMIDGVIHAKEGNDALFAYDVSTSPEDVLKGAKSKYHPVHFDSVIKRIRGDGKRYAFVGVPCFVKSIRLICENDEVVNDQIKYCIALFCGHMKTATYAGFLSGQVGVTKSDLKRIDYRVKDKDAPANRYKFMVEAEQQGHLFKRAASVSSLYGVNWGLGYFKPKACDWCDDIVGELADVSSGDAWLPGYVDDPEGNNIVVVRSQALYEVIEDGRKNQSLSFDVKEPEDVYLSQAGNYRHRREGLSVRIRIAESEGSWRPRKRIKCDEYTVPRRRIAVYRHRVRLSALSHDAFLLSREHPLRFAGRMFLSEIQYYRVSGNLVRGTMKLLAQLALLGYRRMIYKAIK